MNGVIKYVSQRAGDVPGRINSKWRGALGRLCSYVFVFAVSNACIAGSEPVVQDPALRALSEVINQVKGKYVGPVDDQKIVGDAIRGILKGLDPFSDYLEPAAYQELRQENSGKFGGLGMEVGMEAGLVRVLSTFEDSPAFEAGIKPGDLITRLNDTSVEGLTLEQTIQRARGAPDSTIAVTVLSKEAAGPRVLTLKRAIIQSRSVKSALLASGHGYVKITHFDQRTAGSVRTALAGLHRQSRGDLQGLLIDLRDNPGGLLKSAVAVSSLFLPDDSLVVYTEARNMESRMRLRTSDKGAVTAGSDESLNHELKDLPLVVLVNGGSASAAEILAGALKDHRRATVVGTQTFGKGSVQVLVPLADGAALKLTTALYFTPNGYRIQGKGLTPDKIIDQAAIDTVEGIKPAAHTATSTAAVGACGISAIEASAAPNAMLSAMRADCQLQRALDLLRHLPMLARS